ncbi:hypothetical protein N3K66_004233 [Trichothecium roseum]|uniref:Uncharacterized protein n=1 Tax=Trichothecium roseum TaxID=47278 RepID=A0ACC0V2H1_9HYPO|nr:hypothetical protein N3K66_004233 [Trichothecium roseum]
MSWKVITAMGSTSGTEYGPINTLGPVTTYLRPELRDLKRIGVEEHVTFPDLVARIPDQGMAVHAKRVFNQLLGHDAMACAQGRTVETGAQRIRDMDEGGIAIQILSLAGPVNCMQMDPEPGAALSRDINDRLETAVDAHPNRFIAMESCRSTPLDWLYKSCVAAFKS